MRTLIHILPLVILFSVNPVTHADVLTHAQQRIQIQYKSPLANDQRALMIAWLQRVSDALLTVYGEWPKDSFDITIQNGSSIDSPVPWGQVTRGNPDNVLLVVNANAGLEELVGDWTAFHELSHLLIPYQGQGDNWFSEGLATYYQNIIQARAGLLSETGMWNKLAAGFERGRKQNQWSQFDLAEVSENMRKYREFMRVHWSGAHYWLTADLQIRQLSKNKTTLDSLLKQLKNCCEHASMSAAAIAKQLDRLATAELSSHGNPAVSIFEPLFDEHRHSFAMPEYRQLLTGLGVMTGENNQEYKVSLTADAPNASIRNSIYTGDVH